MFRNIIASTAVAVGLVLAAPGISNAQEADPTMNIVETAVNAGSFNTLVAAVKAAGLVETLSGPGPFTVFAPTDEAFAQVPEEMLTALLADKEALTALLTYHVVASKIMAADVGKLNTTETVNGRFLDIKVMDGKVMIDGAEVISADIETTNGVIHVINRVILPEM